MFNNKLKINNNSIRMKILMPYLIIILFSLLITGTAFNVIIKFYISQQIKTEIIKHSSALQRMVNDEPPLFRDSGRANSNNYSDFNLQTAMRIGRVLGPRRFLSNINHAVISHDGQILFPRMDNSPDYNFTKNRLLPLIGKDINTAHESDKITELKYDANKYMVTSVKVDNRKTGNSLWVILYADLSQLQTLQSTTTIILIFILFITALISLATAITISAKITKPLTDLCSYAHTIGERNFEKRTFIGTSSEIEELANSMTTMSQKLEVYDAAQKTFLQNASHELRTPLMSIQGYAEGIKLGILEDNRRAADIIIDESKRLTKLVENILYLTRLDTLLGFYQMERISFNEIIKSIVDKTKGIALKEGKEIQMRLPDSDITIIGDEEKLSRAFINILGNCLRYAKNYVSIMVEYRENVLQVIISDDGRGFDAQDLENLFVRFYKGKDGKFGLGLPIAKTIIEKHSGSITAQNISPNGAQFIVTLPDNASQ